MNATDTLLDSCIDHCNSLLRGEISAVETYTQAVAKFETGSERPVLERLRSDHEKSAHQLRQHVLSMGGEPASSSGGWGAFAKAVEGSAKILGESAALKALQEGEEHGIKEYEEALDSREVMDEIKTAIRGDLLPRLRQHIAELEALRPK